MSVLNFKDHASKRADDIKVIYEGREGKILSPQNEFASAKLAKGTDWTISNPKTGEFKKIKTPVFVFIPSEPRTFSLWQKFRSAAIRKLEGRKTEKEVREKYPEQNIFYNNGLRGPLWGRVTDFSEESYTNFEDLSSKLPNNLVELIVAASLDKPETANLLFSNAHIPLEAIPAQYRTVPICEASLKRAHGRTGNPEKRYGNQFSMFHLIPDAVKQDHDFQQAIIRDLGSLWYRILPTAGEPARLVQLKPDNRDLFMGKTHVRHDGSHFRK